jgi:hypothetical protein
MCLFEFIYCDLNLLCVAMEKLEEMRLIKIINQA